MHPVIGRCPICSSELSVTRLHCGNCDTTVQGEFSLGPLLRLSGEQVRFVQALVRNRGSLKDVGAELNMSYPTVNSRLNDILIALGYGDRAKLAEGQDTQSITPERRREILTDVREGKLTAEEADRLLRGRA
jgi:hypothetical protein